MQVLEGDAMFAKGAPEDGEELAARTVGLVTNAEFKGWLSSSGGDIEVFHSFSARRQVHFA